MKSFENSERLFEEARQYLPGGVDSPVRAFHAVGGTPPFIVRGQGSRIYDADGNEYIDYVGSWGPLILGHSPPEVVEALQQALANGTSFGAPTEQETALAKLIGSAMPSIEMIRFVNSGTEAAMTALRLARAYTRRDKIVKFAGGYHGHADGLLVKAGSGIVTFSLPDSPGVTAACAQNTLVAPYNNISAVERVFRSHPGEIAAVIVEPVAANIGVVPPRPDFLEGLRRLTSKHGVLLIFDEVITGFRVAYEGAQGLYQVIPDLTCLGKIIGGGLPVGACGGRREIMEMLAPVGPVYQAGTLSGNPLAMTAGIETLKALRQPGVYESLDKKAAFLARGINEAIASAKVTAGISRVASLLTVFFTGGEVINYKSALGTDKDSFASFFRRLLAEGVYWPSSPFEAAFVSLAHSDDDIRRTIEAVDRCLGSITTRRARGA